MASSSSLLSEEQFLCPICLDVFIRPVSTPCGHNFCMSCISHYWDDASFSQCPVCKERFQRRPDLKVNTFISELASQLVSLQLTDAGVWSPQQLGSGGSGSSVLCDVCTDVQTEAFRSCVECQTSYCQVHLEPHHRAAGLKRHTLMEPSENLHRICRDHSRVLVLFCRDDNTLLCDVCSSQHSRHNVVHVHRAYEHMKEHLDNMEDKVQQMIQERLQKLQLMTESLKQSRTESEKVLIHGVEDLMVLVSEVQKNQEELIRVVEEKQKAAEQQAGGLMEEMQREIRDLQKTTVKLKEMKQTSDQISFLHSCSNTPLLPPTMDLTSICSNLHLDMQHFGRSVRRSASELRESVDRMKVEISRFSSGEGSVSTLRNLQQHEVNVVLDPDSAHPMLCLSDDGKQVRYNLGSVWAEPLLNPNMFTSHLAVLGRRSFSSCRFYFEVCVGGKTEWCVGVATASIHRRAALIRTSCCGLWAVWFLMDKFETFTCPGVSVYVGKVRRVGVFVDYNKGEISFYDVENATLIYSFTECLFTEELFPYLNPCDNEFGSNLEPLIISPVSHLQ